MQVKQSTQPPGGIPLEDVALSQPLAETTQAAVPVGLESVDSSEPASASSPASLSTLVEEVVTAEYGAMPQAHLKAITDWLQNDPLIADLQRLSHARNEPKPE